MNEYLVLVVEDDKPIRNLITTTLKMNDYRFITAVRGNEAIMLSASHKPDIIILDLGLPDIDGVEVIEHIRTWSDVPIIIVSARSEDRDKITALDKGADDYLTKPFSVDELLARLRVIQRRLMKSENISVTEFVNGRLRIDYGISADILGCVIEKASGVKYSRFLKENIFEPLGMNDTGFFVPAEKLSRFTALYKYENDKLVRDYENYLGLTDYTAPPSFESGGAGLVSTIADYAKFANMLCNRGKFGDVQLISSESFDYMTAPKLGAVQQSDLWERLNGYNYACLMRIMTDESSAEIKTSNGEFGWDGWTGTYFCANPENGIVCLCFTQIAGAGTTWQAQKIDKIVYDELVR